MIAEETRTNRADRRHEPTARARSVWFKGSIVLLSQVLTAGALAQEGGQAPSLPEPADDETPTRPAGGNQVLEERIAELTERLNRSEEERQKASVSPLTWNGYVDTGFFAPIGNHGVGWVRDFGNVQFPEYSNFGWTFLGDILGSPVNSRGEAADLGDSTGLPEARFDSVDSRGAGGFIVNEVNLRPRYALTENAIARASINFVPRTGNNFALGDFVEVDQAELEYVLTRDGKTSIFAGKMMPVFGIEYKERKADQRYGITPSLIARYTTGPQVGVKIRSKLLNDWLILAASVTNNSSVVEPFHFGSEIDTNWGKVLNGRAAVSIPLGSVRDERLEIGVSGEWGPQDRAVNNAGKIWFAGIDLQLLGAGYALRAQVMEGGAPGRPIDGAWGLDLKPSGYVQADWQIFSHFGVYARADLRDAIVTLDMSRIYITRQVRYTGGVHLTLNSHMIVKAEYFHNDEYGGIKDFTNDMFTSSLLLAF